MPREQFMTCYKWIGGENNIVIESKTLAGFLQKILL